MKPKNEYQHSLVKDLLKDDQVKDFTKSSSFTAESKKKQIIESPPNKSDKKLGRPAKEKHLLADTPIINVNINST